MKDDYKCSICGKPITPETGVSVARRWLVCNEHAPIVRNSIVTVGRTAVGGIDLYLKYKAPKLHQFLNAAIDLALQHRTEQHD